MSFWLVVFNALCCVNLAWTVVFWIALLTTDRDCGNDCEAALGTMLIWILGEFLIAPPFLVAIGAVFADRDRRRFRNVWIGLSALVLTLCVMLTVTLIMQFTEPPPYWG
ncbi:MAG: hypothetical protein HY874_05380 [Chloroflexi bacterium]|nr:hypothetical protein [Chloroflexota bacterium]